MSIHIEIAVPEKSIFTASDAIMVIVPGVDGQFTVLPGHAPLVSLLSKGKLTYRSASSEEDFLVTGGLIRVENNQVMVIADGLNSK
jgi:F-type H+-transporting ATPase subunit epsilon